MPDLCDVCRSALPLVLLSWFAHDDLLNPGEPGAVHGTWIQFERAEAVHARVAPDTAELTEVTRIDGHEHLLSVIAVNSPKKKLAVARDGTMAINQYQERLVRLFDAAGHPIGTVGGWGQGPGEFERPLNLAWQGDTLWVVDGGLLRVNAFSRSAEYLTSFRYRDQTDPATVDGEALPMFRSPAVVPWDVSADPIPSLYVLATFALPPAGRFEDAMTLLRMTAFGEVERLIAYMPPPAGEYSTAFRNWHEVDLSRRAGRAVHALGAPLEGPDAGTFDVTAVDLEGDTVFTRRLPFELVRITDSVRDSVLDGYRNSVAADRIRSEPVPPFFPPLHDLVVGDDGSVWLELRPRGDGQPYLVLDTLGAEVGTAVLPPRSQVAVARLDRIWAVEKDEFDVESVVVYDVAWP